MIRRATEADVPRIVEMAQAFWAESSYRERMDPPAMADVLARGLIDRPDAMLLVVDAGEAVVGMLGVVALTHPMNGQRIASEVVWWLDPDERRGRVAIHMLRAAEQWARDQGATVLQMIAPDDRVERLYTALHYQPMERVFQRSLS